MNTDKLDFTGDKFDPTYALQNPDQALRRLPCRNGKTFNNLDEYYKKTFARSAVSNPKQDPVVEPDRKFTSQQIEACKRPLNTRWKDPPDVLSRMAKAVGPLSLLKKLLGQRVKLLIRRRKLGPVSSHYEQITGQLVAFDKHINLILLDVDRVVMVGADKRQRHSKQLFMRGDNVIYAAKC